MSKKDEKDKDITGQFSPTIKNFVPTVKTFFSQATVAIFVLLIITIGTCFLYLVIQGLLPPTFSLLKGVSDIDMLSANLKLLTILVAVIALFAAFLSYFTRREWDKFREEQEPLIKDTRKELEKLKEETEEMNWIETLRKSMEEDPYLNTDKAKETIESIKKHFFERDQYNSSWEHYGVARWFDKKEINVDALEYYDKAADVNLEDDYKSNELSRHIYQSKGKILSVLADERLNKLEDIENPEVEAERENYANEAIDKYDQAIKAFEQAFHYSKDTYAYSKYTIGNAYLGKAKVFEKQGKEPEKNEAFEKAIPCYDAAIKMEDRNSRDWWGNFHYGKASAFALRNENQDAKEAIKELKEALKWGVKGIEKPKDNPEENEDFYNLKDNSEFQKIAKKWQAKFGES